MDIEIIKKLILRYQDGYNKFLRQAREGKRYYRNKPDILMDKADSKDEKPLRNADNRIPFNFHGLLVNQKASYLFTTPPAFNVGSEEGNKRLESLLGEDFSKHCKDLCVDASNTSVAWLHVWRDKTTKEVVYAPVPSEQIIPIWSKSLRRELKGVLRTYNTLDDETGNELTVYEYWNDKECAVYVHDNGETVDHLREFNLFYADQRGTPTNTYTHDVGEVPFFCFENNNIHKNDLQNIKPLIDAYCKVFSGFLNDLEDVQEVIFVLTNYGGQDLGEFLADLKQYKTIKLENEGGGDRSGVDTLTIQLPVEAREKFLSTTRSCIFEQGMGVDPEPTNFGNSSGVALKYLYALLEQKSGLMESEFRSAFSKLIRCLCRMDGISVTDDKIIQIWRRTSVSDDMEAVQMAAQSKGIISDRTIISNHPWVESVELELKQMEEDQIEVNPYANTLFEGVNVNGQQRLLDEPENGAG